MVLLLARHAQRLYTRNHPISEITTGRLRERPRSMKAIFLYDGNCAFCRDLANDWIRRTNGEHIEFLSFRNLTPDQLTNLHPSLTPEKCEQDVQLIYERKRFPGFFAVRRMMFWSKTYRWLAPLLYLPLIPYLGMLVMYYLKKRKSNL